MAGGAGAEGRRAFAEERAAAVALLGKLVYFARFYNGNDPG